MIKTLRFTLMSALLAVCGLVSAQDVTLDFTNNDWKLPTDYTKTEGTFTKDGYTITLKGGSAGKGYKYGTNGGNYLMLGQTGATLTLPAFDFAVARIDVVGNDNASAVVTQNIFVGDKAVSTETTGAANADKKAITNTYDIKAEYQAAGNKYTLKVTNAKNTQVTKILIYKAGGNVKKSAALAFSETTVNVEKGTPFTAPTFSKATTAPVKFASDNEPVAAVNAEGVITLGGAEGKAVITATSEANDNFEAGNATCTVYVWHYLTYKKATTVESGKSYLIVAQRDNKTYYGMSIQKNYSYGALKTVVLDGYVDEIKEKSSYDNDFMFEEFEGGFSIKDCYDRYLFQNVTYTTFNLDKDKAHKWNVEAQGDGTFKIEMNGYYMQLGSSTKYPDQIGVNKTTQTNAVLPMLYVLDDSTVGINGITTNKTKGNNVRYNLAGQRVNDSYKGVVIVNGKKMLVK